MIGSQGGGGPAGEHAQTGTGFLTRHSAGAAVVLLAAIALAFGCTPAEKGPAAADPLASLKTGQWIRIEGVLRPDSTGLCDELRILAGDFLDDDWILKGHIQAVDATNREFALAGLRVQVTDDTGFDSPRKTFRGFEALQKGVLVEVEGTYLKPRKFLAVELDDESDDAEREPWGWEKIQLIGKVERVDTRRRLLTAMGFAFQLTDKTMIRSAIE